jgi:hypothetical protein
MTILQLANAITHERRKQAFESGEQFDDTNDAARRSTVNQWELDNSEPRRTDVLAMAKIFECTPAYISYGDRHEPIEVVPDATKLGYAVCAEKVVNDATTEMSSVGSWGLNTDWLREIGVRGADETFIYAVDTAFDAFRPGDRVLVDTKSVLPSPPGVFLIFDGVGMSLAKLVVTPGSKTPEVNGTSAAGDFKAALGKLRIIGRVRGAIVQV